MFDWLNAYDQLVGSALLVNVLMVLSLYVVFQCGVLSLASVGFMADGAYISSLLATKAHWPSGLAIAAGAVLTGVLALLFGRLVLRLRGIYLALGTFALGQVCVLVIANLGITGGNQGIVGIPQVVTFAEVLLVVVLACAGLQLLHRSRVGRALRAMRMDERVAAGVGVDITRYRAWAFAASGVLAGLAGGCDAFRTIAISPSQYSFTLLVQVLALAMIGGSYHWSGPVIAAIVVGLIQQVVGLSDSSTIEGFVYGGLLVAVMLVLPEGIVDRRLARWLSLRRRPSAPTPPAGTAARPAAPEVVTS